MSADQSSATNEGTRGGGPCRGRGELLLAVDCGTQSTRALVFDPEGRLLEKEKVEYEPYVRTGPGRAEQDPRVYWDALCRATRALRERRPELIEALGGMALTTQRDTHVIVDAAGEPVRPAILWLDQRKASPPYRPPLPLRAALAALGMGEAVLRTQEAGKTTWVAQNEPELWARARKVLQVSGYLGLLLTGRAADSVASQIGHLPFDYRRQSWAAPGSLNARLFPVPRELLPELLPPGTIIGELRREAAELCGLPPGLPLLAAGSDKGCETLGAAVLAEDRASLSFGTTATVQTTSARYFEPIPFMPAYPAPIPGRYNPEVEIFRGYWMITWFKRQFAHGEVLEAERRGVAPEAMLDELLRSTEPGAQGLLMQPYWTPMLKMPAAKGAVIGFGDVHERAHLYRAIIEGLAYGLKDGLRSIERAGRRRVSQLAVAGGASQSDEICRISADVFGLPLVRGETYEASGLGAAMIAAAGLGLYGSVEEASRAMARPGSVFEPDPARSRLYAELYERVYKRIYRALGPLYEAIRDITNYPEKAAPDPLSDAV